MSDIDQLAQVLWDYHHVNHSLEKADLIFVLGSHDIRVAEYAAILMLDDYAPLVLFSGFEGVGRDVSGFKGTSEAEVFAARAQELGVPAEKILIENKATNTGENIRFSAKLLAQKGLSPQKIIAVQKPYMERRTYATLCAQWPDPKPSFFVTSQPISMEEYLKSPLYPKDYTINVMVGDLQRIKEYAKLGFQIKQEIPDKVWDAYEKLVALGYTDHLLS